MNKLEKFYKNSIRGTTHIAEFTFEKTPLSESQHKDLRLILTGLLKLIAVFIYRLHKFRKFKTLGEEFLQNLDFIEEFYSFLRKNEHILKAEPFDLFDTTTKATREVFEKFKIMGHSKNPYLEAYTKATAQTIFKDLDIIQYPETLLFDECLSELHESCMKLLTAIICINDNLYPKYLGDFLFDIHYEIYHHMIPCNFEDLDKKTLGMITQINWLKKKVGMK